MAVSLWVDRVDGENGSVAEMEIFYICITSSVHRCAKNWERKVKVTIYFAIF